MSFGICFYVSKDNPSKPNGDLEFFPVERTKTVTFSESFKFTVSTIWVSISAALMPVMIKVMVLQ